MYLGRYAHASRYILRTGKYLPRYLGYQIQKSTGTGGTYSQDNRVHYLKHVLRLSVRLVPTEDS